ncbi:MAG: hypothetical protein WA002_10155 [Candidatus Acidiferrales bacterium]
MKPRLGILIQIAALAIAGAFAAHDAKAQGAPGSALQDQLGTQYKSSTVLVIQKDGIMGFPSDAIAVIPTKYENGKLHGPNSLLSGMLKNGAHSLPANEKVNPTKVDVNVKNEKVTISIT